MSNAEMMRNFLLLKNKKGQKKIDIDEKIKNSEENKTDEEQRLREIEKKRQDSIDEDLLK
jgi:hypothetical protein